MKPLLIKLKMLSALCFGVFATLLSSCLSEPVKDTADSQLASHFLAVSNSVKSDKKVRKLFMSLLIVTILE